MPFPNRQKSSPFFSIIIPTFNRREMLLIALQSIASQTFQDWEAIVIDDGGMDDTREACLSFCDMRIKYYWKENEERSVARNYGIKRATGAYVNFLDSDDYFSVDHLGHAFEILNEKSFPDVLHVGFKYVSPDGELLGNAVLPTTETTLQSLLYDNPLTGNAIFVKNSIINEINFFPSREATISEDWYLWIRLAVRHEFQYSDKATVSVVDHKKRSTSEINPFQFEKSLNALIKGLSDDALLRKKVGADRLNNVLAYQTLGIGQQFLINKKRYRRNALGYLRKAVAMDPKVMLTRRFLACLKKLVTRDSH